MACFQDGPWLTPHRVSILYGPFLMSGCESDQEQAQSDTQGFKGTRTTWS